jgi:competence CoiA-like predicted nuclease
MRTKEEIQQELDNTRIEFRRLQERLEKLAKELCAVEHQEYPIGCIVEDHRGDRYIVSSYDVYWVLGRKLTKGGVPSKKENGLYNLESCKIIARGGEVA